jgi:outer membrane lipoprotein-sorting protein
MKLYKTLSILIIAIGIIGISFKNTDPTPVEIIKKVQENANGISNQGEVKMTIIRPTWTREMKIKTWSKGTDFSLILITAPAREKGTAFLKRDKELWNWQPTIDRVIKMPPSMMMQSWMGSDFSNDDMVQQSDPVKDFTHRLLGTEVVEGRECYVVEMIPKEETAVVWGKVLHWVDVKDYLELKTEFYDEDGYLVNTILGKNIKELGGRLLPTRLEVIPEEEEGHKTIVEQVDLKFDVPMKESFFSVQNMKRIR